MEIFWFAFDIPRYESKTSHLSMLQEGAYNRLIRHYYKTCSPIPSNEQQIVIITKSFSTEEIEAVSYVLKQFFHLESDGWHQDTCDEEIAKARKISRKRRENGKQGGLAKARNLLQQTASKTLDNNNNNNNKDLKTKAASAFVTPDWLPQEEWQAFEEMRRKIRKPMTDHARSLIVTKLHKLRSHGHSPKQVLEQSIRNSWQDVFEVKGDGTHQQNNRQSRAREIASNNAAAFAAAMGGTALDFGAVTQQGTEHAGNRALEGEVKRLPERSS